MIKKVSLLMLIFTLLTSCGFGVKKDRKNWDFKNIESNVKKMYGRKSIVDFAEKSNGTVLFVEVSGSDKLPVYGNKIGIPASYIAYLVYEEPFAKYYQVNVRLNVAGRKHDFVFAREDIIRMKQNMYVAENISMELSNEQFDLVYDRLDDSFEDSLNKPAVEEYCKELVHRKGKVVFTQFQGFEFGRWNGRETIRYVLIEKRQKIDTPLSITLLPDLKESEKKVTNINNKI